MNDAVGVAEDLGWKARGGRRHMGVYACYTILKTRF